MVLRLPALVVFLDSVMLWILSLPSPAFSGGRPRLPAVVAPAYGLCDCRISPHPGPVAGRGLVSWAVSGHRRPADKNRRSASLTGGSGLVLMCVWTMGSHGAATRQPRWRRWTPHVRTERATARGRWRPQQAWDREAYWARI